MFELGTRNSKLETEYYNHGGHVTSVTEKVITMRLTKPPSTLPSQRPGSAVLDHYLHALPSRLFAPVDISFLVYFRVIFGAIMLWEVWRYFSHDWIRRYYIEPTFYFHYFGFDWIRPWPGDGMYLHFCFLGALATCIMIGLWYRVATVLFFLGFTYVFLLDQTRYLNHFYLISLLAFLMIFLPAHRALSVDAWRNRKIRSDTSPAWTLWLLRAQIGIPYFYGGIAKLNGDWLRGEPMRMWLAERIDFPVVGALFTEEWMVYLFVWGGLLLDLLIVPLLLWRRTRPFVFAAAVLFHLLNAQLFQIGIFPWFMLAATLIFFPPDLPRRLFAELFRRRRPEKRPRAGAPTIEHNHATPAPKVTLAFLAVYLTFQVLVPLRHFLYPGNVNWTEEGHRFSWHMKLRDKEGDALFTATEPASGETWIIDPREYLTSRQRRTMATHPDMILQFSQYLADEMRRTGRGDVEIRAQVSASLNGRQKQLLIDPSVNLAGQKRNLWPSGWIVPLSQPLPDRKTAREAVDGEES